jgi:hypothetical protein
MSPRPVQGRAFGTAAVLCNRLRIAPPQVGTVSPSKCTVIASPTRGAPGLCAEPPGSKPNRGGIPRGSGHALGRHNPAPTEHPSAPAQHACWFATKGSAASMDSCRKTSRTPASPFPSARLNRMGSPLEPARQNSLGAVRRWWLHPRLRRLT